MRSEFRLGLVEGIAAAVAIGSYCFWLWREERQIARHTANLFYRIEQRKWSGVADLIAPDCADQWGNDRALVLERMRLLLGSSHNLRLSAADPVCKADNNIGVWQGRITIDSDDPELMVLVNERINSLTAPFELQWRHVSGKPWDWKLIRVSNPELEIPAGFE